MYLVTAVKYYTDFVEGAFTQSVLRGVIRRRLGYVIDKKYFFHLKNNHFTPRNTPWCERYLSVNEQDNFDKAELGLSHKVTVFN